jgi:PAS domain S-box-containing protein
MRRILVVEDDRFISTIFKMFLAELGHEIVARCESGLQAIELCHQLKPDVVLMDIHLQGELDGIQTAEKLKMELDLPVIYISGDTSNTIIERAIVSNSYGYLVKPVNKKELGISIDLAFYKHKVDIEQKKRERGYREFISESPVPIIVLRKGRIQYLNKLALEGIMKTHYIEDVMGLEFLRFVAAESKDRIAQLLSGEGLSDDRFVDEYVLMKDLHGDPIYAELSGSVVRFNNEISTQIIIRDVTHRVNERQRADFYKDLIINSELPFVLLDRAFTLLESNEAAIRCLPFLGIYTSSEIIEPLKKAIEAVEDAENRDNGFDILVKTQDTPPMKMKAYGMRSQSGLVGQWLVTLSE